MRWKPGQGRSDNIEDRRGSPGAGGLGGLPIGGKGGGIIGLVLVLLVAFGGAKACTGGGDGDSASGGFDVGQLEDILGQLSGGGGGGESQGIDEADDPEADLVDFVDFVQGDVQGFWDGYFDDAGQRYAEADVVLFRQGVSTGGCGSASSATGPFYCPADQKAYIDLGFFRELTDRFGAPGDFAQAYVLAHELGHHVQNLLGIDDEVRRLQGEDPDRTNELSVRQELQADCFAGVWAHSAFQRDLLSDGDIEEGLGAAASVGDDRLGAGSPENYTHGSAEARQHWLTTGYDSGDVNACDTFEADESELGL